MSRTHNPSEFRQIQEIRNKVLDRNSVRDATLFVAHRQEGYTISELSKQTKINREEIEHAVEYIDQQMRDALDYQS